MAEMYRPRKYHRMITALQRKRQQARKQPPGKAPSSAASATATAPHDESDSPSDHDRSAKSSASTSDAELEEISSGHGPSANSAATTRKQLARIEGHGRHFSKISSQYRFEAQPSNYMAWCVQFKSQLEEWDLIDVLETDPAALGEAVGIEAISKQQQKTVYHMILHCVPNAEVRTVVTTALAASEHTGFHAWRALREHFIGDEQAYVQTIETRFQHFEWADEESWATMETRFTALVAELVVAGVHKQPHQKRACLMEAIRMANRKDAQLTPVFNRLNTVNVVKEESEFQQWLTAIRIEAQKIHDELCKKGVKRGREEAEGHGDRERKHETREVSFIGNAESASAPAPRYDAPRAGTSAIPCRDFLRTGQCRFGSSCKYSHKRSNSSNNFPQNRQGAHFRPPGPSGNRNFSSNSNSGRGSSTNADNICFSWRDTGRCARGPGCRFQHPPAHGGRSAAGMFIAHQGAHFAEAYSVGSSQEAAVGSHRIIADSGASVSLTPRRDFIRQLLPLKEPMMIRGAFGQPAVARFYGDAYIPAGGGAYLIVPEMVFCESLRDTLLSMSKLLKRGHRIEVNAAAGTGIFIDRSDKFIIPISLQGNIFSFDFQQNEVNVTTRARFRTEQEQEPAEAAAPAARATSPPNFIAAAPSPSAASDSASSIPPSSQLAHDRYGHLCGRKLDQLIDAKGADGMVTMQKHRTHNSLIAKCDACMLAKAKRESFGVEMAHGVSAPNDKLVGDVIGPISVRAVHSSSGATNKYYVSMLTDVWSRCVSAQIMSEKKPSDHVISYLHRSKITTGRDLKHFHTDGGKEYNRAERVLEARGVKVTRTPIHTPQWNAIAERKNRTITESARALLLRASLGPDEFWSYAVETAVFLHNRTNIVNPQGKTAHELFTGQKPDVSLLRVFGCKAIVHSADEHPGKFDPRGLLGILVGYDTKRELCYRIRVGDKIIVSRDVRFDESEFPGESNVIMQGAATLKNKIDRCLSGTSADSNNDDSTEEHGGDEQESSSGSDSDQETKIDARTLRKIAATEKIAKKQQAEPSTRSSSRARTAAKQTGLNPDDFGRIAFAVSSSPAVVPADRIRAIDVSIPGTVRAALASRYAAAWQSAMEAEMSSIVAHETFQVVDLPDAQTNLVSSKWVFAIKQESGWVTRFKARLVARGFTQQHGVDFDETYSSVARLKTVRCFLACVAIRDLELELMDVETAYLNAPLKERVYMKQPQGFHQGPNNAVWLLKKALYGLRQSGREWHLHVDQFIRSLGFARCAADQCVYLRTSRSGRPIFILLYVDDIPSAFASEDRAEWEEIKRAFADKYKIKFLGEADWFLGMAIARDRKTKTLLLHQKSYAETVLEEFGMEECRGVASPGAQDELCKQHCPTTPEEIAAMRRIPYRQAVGSLMYLSNCTRPDLAHAVQLVAQFAQNPGETHWRAVIQILRYLSSTTHFGLQFGAAASPQPSPASSPSGAVPSLIVPRSDSALTVFADANWGSCRDSRRSTSGWLISLCGSWIDWSCKKQETVALSSCEAEYVAASAAAAGVTWTVQLLREIGFMKWIAGGGQLSPIPLLFSDNRSALAMSQTDSLHSRSKHIDIKHHFIREQVEHKAITLQWISTHQQVADILTKTLPPRLFTKFRDALVTPINQGAIQGAQPEAAATTAALSIAESDSAMLDPSATSLVAVAQRR